MKKYMFENIVQPEILYLYILSSFFFFSLERTKLDTNENLKSRKGSTEVE